MGSTATLADAGAVEGRALEVDAGAVGDAACWAATRRGKDGISAKQKSNGSGRWEKFSRMGQVRFGRILAECILFVNWHQRELCQPATVVRSAKTGIPENLG